MSTAEASRRLSLPGEGRVQSSARWAELGLILGGAAVVMLLPRLFGDPQSVDPDDWRLTAYFALVAGVALASRRLRSCAPLGFSLLTLTLPYSTWDWLLGYTGPASGVIGAPYGLARNAWAGVAWLLLAAVMAGCYWVMSPRPRPRLRLLSRPNAWAIYLTVGVSLLFLGVAFLLPGPFIGREGVPLLALGGSAALSLGVANAAQAIAQEIQFRGVLMPELERRHGRGQALVLQAVIFGVAHIAIQYQGPAGSVIPIVILLGLIWGWMSQRSNSVIPAMVVHVLAEFFLLATIVSGLYGG